MLNAALIADLVESLRLLAAPASVQRDSFPDWVAIPDEIALTFSDTYDVAPIGELPDQARAALEQIAERLERMWGEEGSDIWDERALRSSTSWQDLRQLASLALRELDQPYRRPQLSSARYVRSRFTR